MHQQRAKLEPRKTIANLEDAKKGGVSNRIDKPQENGGTSRGVLEREFSVNTVKSFWETKPHLDNRSDIRQVSTEDWSRIGMQKDGNRVRPVGSKASSWMGPRTHHRSSTSKGKERPKIENKDSLPMQIEGPANLLDMLQSKATTMNEEKIPETPLTPSLPSSDKEEVGEKSRQKVGGEEEPEENGPASESQENGNDKTKEAKDKTKPKKKKKAKGSRIKAERIGALPASSEAVLTKKRSGTVCIEVSARNSELEFKEATPRGKASDAGKRLSGEIGSERKIERKVGSHIVRSARNEEPKSASKVSDLIIRPDSRKEESKEDKPPSPSTTTSPTPLSADRKEDESQKAAGSLAPPAEPTPAQSSPRRRGHTRSRSTGLMGLGNIISRGREKAEEPTPVPTTAREGGGEEKTSSSSNSGGGKIRVPFLHSRTNSIGNMGKVGKATPDKPAERPIRKKEKEKEKEQEQQTTGRKTTSVAFISESRPVCKDGANCNSSDPYHFLEYQHTSISTSTAESADSPISFDMPDERFPPSLHSSGEDSPATRARRSNTVSQPTMQKQNSQKRLSLKKKLEPLLRSTSEDKKLREDEEEDSNGDSRGSTSPNGSSINNSSSSEAKTQVAKKKRHSLGSLTDLSNAIKRNSIHSDPQLPSQLEQMVKLNETPPSNDHVVHGGIMAEWRQSKMLSAEGSTRLAEALKAMSEAERPVCLEVDGWNVERGDDKQFQMHSVPSLEEEDQHTPFYKLHFYDHPHEVFYGDTAKGPVIISIVDMDTARHIQASEKREVKKSQERTEKIYRVLVQTRKGPRQLFIKSSPKPKHKLRAVKLLCEAQGYFPEILDAKVKEVKETIIKDELLRLEKLFFSSNHKFGVLYCKKGQDENQMFSNETTSPAFEEFLRLLGDRITLKGWKDYTGGLDAKTETTGTHSVYRNYRNLGIMFHVSTLLPFFPKDEQQVERKRHLGNDIGVIVYVEEGGRFDPSLMTTQFNHIYGVVSRVGENMRLEFATKDGVRPFGPRLPSTQQFKLDTNFIDFLLTKMINGERAALGAPVFAQKLEATRRALLQGVVDKAAKGGA